LLPSEAITTQALPKGGLQRAGLLVPLGVIRRPLMAVPLKPDDSKPKRKKKGLRTAMECWSLRVLGK